MLSDRPVEFREGVFALLGLRCGQVKPRETLQRTHSRERGRSGTLKYATKARPRAVKPPAHYLKVAEIVVHHRCTPGVATSHHEVSCEARLLSRLAKVAQ
jgi:hypothetical protein